MNYPLTIRGYHGTHSPALTQVRMSSYFCDIPNGLCFAYTPNAGHLSASNILLEMFGMLDETQMTPLLTRYVLKDKALWATCDVHDENKKKCAHLFNKFLPAFHVDPSTFSTTEDFRFQPKQQPHSKYVCARHGAAGLAMLTDHGVKVCFTTTTIRFSMQY